MTLGRRPLVGLALLSALVLACRRESDGPELKIAAAANVVDVLDRIAAEFTAGGGAATAITSGSSGKLLAQIENGAPFHVFLSADAERPARLVARGFAVAGTVFTYALGRLALVGRKLEHPGDGSVDLRAGAYQRLAVANPDTAPYGVAALQVLEQLGVPAPAPRLVRGENVAQALQFVDSGAADLGLVALANVVGRGRPFWKVPASLHAPIRQDAVLLEPGRHVPAAAEFLRFLRGARARALLAAAGYDVPPEG